MIAVYILASRRNGTLYTGSTWDLPARIWAHKTGQGGCFTARYQVHQLVWYESHASIAEARGREHAIKRWRRQWKLNLIERGNPHWEDLYAALTVFGAAP